MIDLFDHSNKYQHKQANTRRTIPNETHTVAVADSSIKPRFFSHFFLFTFIFEIDIYKLNFDCIFSVRISNLVGSACFYPSVSTVNMLSTYDREHSLVLSFFFFCFLSVSFRKFSFLCFFGIVSHSLFRVPIIEKRFWHFSMDGRKMKKKEKKNTEPEATRYFDLFYSETEKDTVFIFFSLDIR